MFKSFLLPAARINFQVICVRNKQIKVPKIDKKLQSAAESLASRGFLRPNKPWDPPADIEKQIDEICSKNGLRSDSEFESLEKKFVVLKLCFEETGHSVPNSLLHTIETVGDLKEFYATPVDSLTPFDSLKKMEDLPKNLHVQGDYLRFHPDKDTLFKGKSAFPQSSTIVTGLKARTKYEGYSAKRKWP
ncbi:39S ribosomal protein L50, mitochondrial [Aricia agestis]|uniref:39S ribosomal protein L50, mitochondrial n=1 Tax=Aricia agestis TaxID=91739 RepID=UPI001C202D2A|nr:39S ribosomal protein L50, mitochondrial [Aricia agestis]XP_041977002.1 39S ribosomal protein L50, mitochondrial [Aricia agestis]